MNEVPVVFECRGETLVGVVTRPDAPAERGVLIIVGGPQYRIGSHRQFVHLARALAGSGIAAMRFDYRGMGDSSGPFHDLEEINPDIGAAVDELCRQVPSLRSVTLWGLCGGASAALLYWLAERDARIGALALVNPWIRSEATQARTRVKHYYLQRLAQPVFWRKLLAGGVARDAIPELLRNVRQMLAPRPEAAPVRGLSDAEIARRMREGWAAFPGPILLALSGADFTARQFLEAAAIDAGWRRNLRLPTVHRVDLTEADHTCTDPDARAALERESIRIARAAGVPVAYGTATVAVATR